MRPSQSNGWPIVREARPFGAQKLYHYIRSRRHGLLSISIAPPSLAADQVLQGLFPDDRSAGIVTVLDDHLAVEFTGERDDLPVGQFVRRPAEAGLQFAPSPLVMEIALGATDQRL